MNRFFTSLIATASVAAALQAQCFESNFGTQIGLGDDLAFPSTTTATAFTMAGFPVGATTYTHFTVNTNGVVFPWTAATGVVGATATGYSTAPATQLTNLRGAAGGAPRIAPLWRDLNLLAANNGALWVNNSASKCVFTWANAVQFATTGPIFTVQAQLFPNGDVQFFYNGTLASNAATITGISEGGGIAAVAGSDLSVGPNVATTNLIFEQFAANTIDLQTTGLSFVNTGGAGYVQTASPCVPATTTSYGTGCYAIPGTGAYEALTDAAIASADLQGNALLLTPAGSGYTSTWVPGGATGLYVAPTAGATALPANDDGFAVVAVPGAGFPTASGLVTQFNVASNGVIAFGSTNSNGADFSPTGPEFAAATVGNFYSWHDYNPAEVGSGLIKTELVGNTFHITWDAVENYSTPLAVNTSTLQFSFDLTSGAVTMTWVTIDTNITSTFGSAYLVGWKGAGAVADAGTVDLATVPQTTSGSVSPLALSAAGAPIIGSTVTYTTSNIPEFAPGTGLRIGLHILSVNQVPAPGLDLVIIGAPGCSAFVGTLDLTTTLVGFGVAGATQSNSLAIPGTAPIGFQLFAQSIALIAPNSLPNGQNAFGLVSSNGLASTLNTF